MNFYKLKKCPLGRIRVIFGMSCILCIMLCTSGCQKEKEPVGTNTPTFRENYMDDFRRIGARAGEEAYTYGAQIDTLASQMGLDYTDKTMPLMHVNRFDSEYIYDEYVNFRCLRPV